MLVTILITLGVDYPLHFVCESSDAKLSKQTRPAPHKILAGAMSSL